MKIKYINLKRNYKNTKLYKKFKKTLIVVSVSAFIGISHEKVEFKVEDNTNAIYNNTDEKINSNVATKTDTIIVTSIAEPEIIEKLDIEQSKEVSLVDISETLNQETNVNDKKLVALTFDDGPSKYTIELINILKENNARATFFLLGTNISKYPETIASAYENGNEIGIHGYSHTSFKQMSILEVQDEIDLTRQLIENCGVECSDLIRPPYGNINDDILSNISSTFILWNVDTRDWESRDVEKIKEEVIGKIEDGDIILFHDIYKTTVQAIDEILLELSSEYEFVTVTELFRLKEQELEENKKYYKVKR